MLTSEEPEYRAVVNGREPVRDINLKELRYSQTATQDGVSVAVAHLPGMEVEDYLQSFYHISSRPNAPAYNSMIEQHLDRLAGHLETTGSPLNFLVFPEVFLPLNLERALTDFSRKFNTIIIGGIEYDRQADGTTADTVLGENRCLILVPGAGGEVHRFTYSKLTRSQYDARTPPSNVNGDRGYFKLKRGDSLIRFVSDESFSFGVLICYDFSHLDITACLNLHGRDVPPEILFVVAYNPDGDLYRRCCIADAHRFYQYVVMCNVSQFGGSGVFGPVRPAGERQTVLHAGQNAQGISIAQLDLVGLITARKTADTQPRIKQFMKKPGLLASAL